MELEIYAKMLQSFSKKKLFHPILVHPKNFLSRLRFSGFLDLTQAW